jgi:hypothetical protein
MAALRPEVILRARHVCPWYPYQIGFAMLTGRIAKLPQ